MKLKKLSFFGFGYKNKMSIRRGDGVILIVKIWLF